MVFLKCQNRHSLVSWDTIDVDDMTATMTDACKDLATFKDMILPMGMDAMDYNDIMHSRSKDLLHDLIVTKVMFLYIVFHFAETMRPTKNCIEAVFMKVCAKKSWLMRKCNLHVTDTTADWMATKAMLLLYAFRTACPRVRKRIAILDHARSKKTPRSPCSL